MRDNHDGMPEFIDAFESDGHYFVIIEIEIEKVFKRFQFGVSRASFLALSRVLQLWPFDMMPGVKYRYFYARSSGIDEYKMTVRIEQERDSTTVKKIAIPKDLHANLLWFNRLRSFETPYIWRRKFRHLAIDSEIGLSSCFA